jgi:hypothetical protein
MDLSIRKDASNASEEVPSEEVTSESEAVPSEEVPSESFPNEEDIETAALVTDPLANLKADFESQMADFESLALTMELSIPKDAPVAWEDVPSEEVTSESFPNEEEDSETAALVTADPLANLKADFESQLRSLKADFESQKADFESQKTKFNFESQLNSQQTKADFESQLGSLKADFERQKTKADYESQLNSQQTKADFESQLGSLKADFESQLESQNAGIRSLKKFGLFSLKISRSRLEDEGKKQLPPDKFLFRVCSKILSQPFVLGFTVFIFQITIYSLLAVDLIKPFSDNPLGIPANVETTVRGTQFLALIVAVLTQADIRISLEQVNEGYNKDRIGNEFAEASCGKRWFATACRFLQRALGLVVTFFLIVREDNVFDLLLNFTAMEFVSQLDDVAFFVAGTEYFGSKSAEKSEEIDERSYLQAADEKKRRKTLHILLLIVIFSGALAGWGVIVKQQISNKYLCEQFFVYSTQTELTESGFYKRTMPRGHNYERVQYLQQNGAEESESGFRFGYCDQETAWTLSSGGDPCNNFSAKSADTTTFDIRTTLFSSWVSDNLVQLDPIRFLCLADARVGKSLPSELGNLKGLGEFINSVTRADHGSARVSLIFWLPVCLFLSAGQCH